MVVAVLIVAVVGFFVIHGKFVIPPQYPASAKAVAPANWVRTAASDDTFSVALPPSGNLTTDPQNPDAVVVNWLDPKNPAFWTPRAAPSGPMTPAWNRRPWTGLSRPWAPTSPSNPP